MTSRNGYEWNVLNLFQSWWQKDNIVAYGSSERPFYSDHDVLLKISPSQLAEYYTWATEIQSHHHQHHHYYPSCCMVELGFRMCVWGGMGVKSIVPVSVAVFVMLPNVPVVWSGRECWLDDCLMCPAVVLCSARPEPQTHWLLRNPRRISRIITSIRKHTHPELESRVTCVASSSGILAMPDET